MTPKYKNQRKKNYAIRVKKDTVTVVSLSVYCVCAEKKPGPINYVEQNLTAIDT